MIANDPTSSLLELCAADALLISPRLEAEALVTSETEDSVGGVTVVNSSEVVTSNEVVTSLAGVYGQTITQFN